MKRIWQHLINEGHALYEDEQGATMIEWTLLLAAIAIPSYLILMYTFDTMVIWYQMITQVNSFPSP